MPLFKQNNNNKYIPSSAKKGKCNLHKRSIDLEDHIFKGKQTHWTLELLACNYLKVKNKT